MPQKQYLY